MHVLSDTRQTSGYVLVLLAVMTLMGCANPSPQPEPAESAEVESPAPVWSEPADPAPVEVVTTRPAPGYTRADGEQVALALENHRAALLAEDSNSLPADEAGYYLDTLEARMVQLLRGTAVRFERRDNQFAMQFASGNSFATNTAQLNEDALAQLRPIVALLVEYDRTQVLIYGHTDDVGETDYNQALSSRRAVAVARVLVDGGVQPQRILVAGFGESRPVSDNSTEEGRAFNRRVELVVEPLVRERGAT